MTGTLRNYAIIVAGGTGSRMGANLPKQFLPLCGKPILMHTIEAFYHSAINPDIILVLHSDFHEYWTELKQQHSFEIPCIVVNNGKERFHSVKNALELINEESLIAVHDAVRPVVSSDLIERTFLMAASHGSAIPAVPSRDSVRKKDGIDTVALNREEIFLVQTPQVFKSGILKNAYLQNYSPGFTDDASVVESAGNRVALSQGDHRNLKITYPEDLEIAQIFLTKKNPA